jgi:hypothetical protein
LSAPSLRIAGKLFRMSTLSGACVLCLLVRPLMAKVAAGRLG